MSESIFDWFPDPEKLLQLDVEELSGYILKHLHSIGEGRAHRFHAGNLAIEISRYYPTQYQQKISNVVMQSCQWLKNRDYIYNRNEQGFFDFTKKGLNAKTADDLDFKLSIDKLSGDTEKPSSLASEVMSNASTPNMKSVIDIFISHSSKDKDVAAALIELLRAALNISSEKIRCTSVDGYRLQAGASTDEQLRREIYEARAFIGLLTPTSLQSTYVLFELGARWGARLHLVPVLASGIDAGMLSGPLTGLNALSCDIPAQVHQLISDIASTLKINTGGPSAYQRYIDALVEQSRQHKGILQSSEQADQAAGSNFSEVEKRAAQRINRIIGKLGTNLDLMGRAFDFIGVLNPEDLTSSNGKLSASANSFSEMPYPLSAFLACEGDENKLKSYARELVEAVSGNVAGGVGIDLTLSFVFHKYHSPLTDFNPDADEIFKEVDTQLGVVCKTLGLRFPGGGMGRYGGRKALTSEQWSRSDLIEAVNILNAARTVLE